MTFPTFPNLPLPFPHLAFFPVTPPPPPPSMGCGGGGGKGKTAFYSFPPFPTLKAAASDN